MTKAGRTRWAGHAAGLRDISHTEFRSGKLKRAFNRFRRRWKDIIKNVS
jgi:hypothetical protein